MELYWIWLAQLKGISIVQKLGLLQRFQDPEEICRLRGNVPGLSEEILEALEDKDLTEAKNIMADCAGMGIRIITFWEECYPEKLRNTYDPPLVLYAKGTVPCWQEQPVIGIVGTRKATPYGLQMAQRFGAEVASCGALVVSGGAAGVDAEAMEGALDAGWSTVGVLGCGVDVVYPATNRALFERVKERGCLLSEYPPGTPCIHWHFPRRNRIISGMSDGLLVVEAPKKSGALITAERAMEQGRDIFVVPGNINVEACAGSNALLQDRAVAALSGWDVVREYEGVYPGKTGKNLTPPYSPKVPAEAAEKPVLWVHTEKKLENSRKKGIDKEEKSTYSVLDDAPADLSEEEQAVFACVPYEPSAVDDVIAGVDMPASTVRRILTKLRMKQLAVSHPGGRISRK